MIKIAIVRSSTKPLNLGYYNIQELGLAKALSQKGIFEIDIYSSVMPLKIWEIKQINEHVRLINIPLFKLPGQQGVCFRLFKLLKIKDYDYIQCHEESQIMSIILAFFTKCVLRKKIILYQGMYEPYVGLKRLMQVVYNFIFLPILKRNTDIVIAKTDLARQYLNGLGFKKIQVIPIGLDEETLRFKTSLKEFNAGIHGFIESNHPAFLYVGVIEKRRNLDFMIKLFARIVGIYQNASLIIIGDGPYRDNVKALIKRLSLQPRVFMLKNLPQRVLFDLYESADIFLLPSNYEIYGMVISECVWFGLPVITTRNAGALEINKQTGYRGLYIDDLSMDCWLEHIRDIFSRPRQWFKENARLTRENLIWSKIVDSYIEYAMAGSK